MRQAYDYWQDQPGISWFLLRFRKEKSLKMKSHRNKPFFLSFIFFPKEKEKYKRWRIYRKKWERKNIKAVPTRILFLFVIVKFCFKIVKHCCPLPTLRKVYTIDNNQKAIFLYNQKKYKFDWCMLFSFLFPFSSFRTFFLFPFLSKKKENFDKRKNRNISIWNPQFLKTLRTKRVVWSTRINENSSFTRIPSFD